MTVKVRLFAVMAQHAAMPGLSVELPEGAQVSAVRELLQSRFTGLPWPAGTMLAVNQEYANARVTLKDGDEVAIIPPVSGG